MYYCSDNLIIDNGVVKRYPEDKYVIFDYFILDLVKKQIYLYDLRMMDVFPETIEKYKYIQIIKSGNDRIISIKVNYSEECIKIIIDEDNRIVGYKNNVINII